MRYIGIDNGKDGAVVVIDETGRVLEKHVAPVIGDGKREYDVSAMVRILKPYEHSLVGGLTFSDGAFCWLEAAQAMPKQGVSSTFSIGLGYGLWQGILTALGIPFATVRPRIWQDQMFRGINHDDTKKASALIASRLSPDTDWRASDRCKIPHDGLTDAYCIAEYGRCLQKG